MKIKAPQITSLDIKTLSANHIHLTWDSVGVNFYYLVELASTRSQGGGIIPESKLQWRSLGFTSDPYWFDESVIYPDNYYKVRISTAATGFIQSSWVYTEEFLSFKDNAYTITKDRKLTLSRQLIEQKFIKNDNTFMNFNTGVFSASLMSENFIYSPDLKNVSSVMNHVLYEDEYHEIQGNIERVCSDINRVYLGEIDGLLYLFEKYQKMVKVSNDKGQTWKYYDAFDDRVGSPVSKTVLYQNDTTTYVLGYDRIFYGRMVGDIRWSDDVIKFSNTTESFTKSDESMDVGFDVHIFSTYAFLPGDISKYAEAFAVSNDFIYTAGKNRLRILDINNAKLDDDPESHSYGKRLFSDEVIEIVPGNDKIVVSKMDTFNNELYILVSGEVATSVTDKTVPTNVLKSKDSGVYKFDETTRKFIKIYGLTDKQRDLIKHTETNMSTDGRELYISYTGYKYEYEEVEVDSKPEYNKTVIPVDNYPYLNDKHKFMAILKMSNDDNLRWDERPSKYYGQAFFTWLAKDNKRCWVNNDYDIVMVYPFRSHQKIIENHGAGSINRIMMENTELGKTVIYCPNIHFDEFKEYAGGILIHDIDGVIIGYYEFNYRVKNEADIIWKPKHVMFSAELQVQYHDKEWVPVNNEDLKDPDLRPFLHKMGPDSYILDDTNFEKFCEYYLEFISNGKTTAYNKLLNLIKLKYPREQDAYEYLWSELNRRNVYLDKDKKDAVVRFFETHKNNFYSTKGIEASYKFLFKALYNEDVEIETETKSGLEYDISVDTDNISEDIVGRTIYTETGRCNVTYIDKKYVDEKPVWILTIHNMIGRFYEGQVIKAETTSFTGVITRGIKGKELFDNSIDYINRNRSHYVMKIRSSLPTSRYSNDILRFVHPTGFGFIGITILTMFINAGISMKHSETIINSLINYRFDSGPPVYFPDRVMVFDFYKEPIRDSITGEVVYEKSTKINELYNVISKDEYNKMYGFVGETKKSNNYKEWLKNTSPWDRRSKFSPLFDQSAVTFSSYRKMTSLLMNSNLLGFDPVLMNLKSNIGNPRDPINPTQVKLED